MESQNDRARSGQPQPDVSPAAPKKRFRLVKIEERFRIMKLEERIVPSNGGGSYPSYPTGHHKSCAVTTGY